MSSVFISDNNGLSHKQQEKTLEPTRTKRPRSSLACIRCRKKKVKCDFVQPTCGRCAVAGLPCSYATPPRRVDGQAFDKLGDHVEELKERMQRMQSELAMIKNNLLPFTGGNNGLTARAMTTALDNEQADHPRTATPLGRTPGLGGQLQFVNQFASATDQNVAVVEPQPVTWKLSLSPSGLRIDTNIASVADLYRILLNGISQLNIHESATSLFSTDAIRSDGPKKSHQAWGLHAQRRSRSSGPSETAAITNGSGTASERGRLWEVDDNEARRILQEHGSADDTVPQETLNHLMHNCYHKCFLAHQIVNQETFMQQYTDTSDLDPLLVNAMNAWMAKHGCIYHNACPGKNPSSVGEAYFKNARQLLKKCFDISSPVTVHALLNLYMYQLSSERSALAYLYIGLAIRMAQDLKFHKKEHMPADPELRETNKRLWWSAYWLDLCAALESNRPTMVDDKDCDLEYPARLDSEDDETGYRIHFCVYSIKLMRIRKDIAKHLPSEQSGQSLLSAISRLENALTQWCNELPYDLRFEPEDVFQPSGSFRDEARLILNIQYQTTWIMLHKCFLPKHHRAATPVALLSLNICTKSANFVTTMLAIFTNHLPWCQFFYTLDGVIASIAIHQVNALSDEQVARVVAQRNLISTANILRRSPLLHMDKINDIIDSIDGFLKRNNLPTDIAQLPVISEEVANQQSMTSIFHPSVMDDHPQNPAPMQPDEMHLSTPVDTFTPGAHTQTASASPSSSTAPSRLASQPSQYSQGSRTLQSSVSSPRSQQPLQLQTPNSLVTNASFQSSSYSNPPSLSSPIPMSPSPHMMPDMPIDSSRQLTPASQPLALNTTPLPAGTSAGLMTGTDFLFDDTGMMNFNGAPAESDMNNMLFRDMGFPMEATSGIGGSPNYGQDLFTSLLGDNRNTNTTTMPLMPQAFGSSPLSFPASSYTQGAGHASIAPPPPFESHLYENPDLFGLQGSTLAPEVYALNTNTLAGRSQTSVRGVETGGYDPTTALFGQAGMNQAAMNAILYAAAPQAVSSGMPSAFVSDPQHTHPGAGQHDFASTIFATSASARKRTNREWDENF